MLRRFVSVLALALLLAPARAQELPTARPEDVGLSSERLGRLTSVLEDYVDQGLLPGVVVLVLRDGAVAYEGTFGNLDAAAGTPMPSDAIFRIASQSKAPVSVGIMMLQEEGKLLIGDRLGKYLPEFAETTVAVAREGGGYDVVPAERPITLRDLLTHTAGIGYGYGPGAAEWEAAGIQGWYFAHREEPIRETVRRMASLPMDAQPGSGFVYGYNTDILGAVIEVVSRQPLDRFLEERIFEPLGMRDTHFYLPPEKADRLAVVYSATDQGLVRAPDESAMQAQGAYVEGPRTSFSGGAGLLSTARDYARFLQMLLNGGELDGQRLLSRTTVALMITDHLSGLPYPWAPGNGFGLGFRILKDPGTFGRPGSVGAFEWGGAYHSKYWVDPAEGLVVVYFTQLIPTGGVDDLEKLWALVYQAIVD
jgi:CubicO group peptidase (beta-lactamase class C family)